MNVFAKNWHAFAYLILAIQAVAWLIAEIFLLRWFGYPIVVLMLILYFVHALAGYQDDEPEAEENRNQEQEKLAG